MSMNITDKHEQIKHFEEISLRFSSMALLVTMSMDQLAFMIKKMKEDNIPMSEINHIGIISLESILTTEKYLSNLHKEISAEFELLYGYPLPKNCQETIDEIRKKHGEMTSPYTMDDILERIQRQDAQVVCI